MPIDRPTASARSDAIQQAKEFNAKALLFIDSDMEFEENSWRRLNQVKADIACGLFYNRTAPSYPTITNRGPKAENGKDTLVPITPDGKVQDIEACGMAFTLIRKPVIQATRYPAFQHLGWISEDFLFCLWAKEKGFTVKCDTGLPISHRGDIGFCGQPDLLKPDAGVLSFPFGITNARESWKTA